MDSYILKFLIFREWDSLLNCGAKVICKQFCLKDKDIASLMFKQKWQSDTVIVKIPFCKLVSCPVFRRNIYNNYGYQTSWGLHKYVFNCSNILEMNV